MIELEIYARGLRDGDHVMQLRNQMDLLPKVRYKIDVNHDIVYFDADSPRDISLAQITAVFEAVGLHSRLVGQIPEELDSEPEVTGTGTTRLI